MSELHDACDRGELETVRRLIEADPTRLDASDAHQWPPIFHAALHRRVEVVRYLIEQGADLSVQDGYVMHYAGEVTDNQEIVAMLVAYGALDAHLKPTDDLSRQLLAAIFLEDEPRVRSLLRRHPRLASQQDGRGDQPIHHAARNGSTAIVVTLLELGADANARTVSGQTTLYCAGGHGHTEVVRRLLKAGADPNVRFTDDGRTLREWLQPYEEDEMFAPVAALLDAIDLDAID